VLINKMEVSVVSMNISLVDGSLSYFDLYLSYQLKWDLKWAINKMKRELNSCRCSINKEIDVCVDHRSVCSSSYFSVLCHHFYYEELIS
jgi:hypothetical protein